MQLSTEPQLAVPSEIPNVGDLVKPSEASPLFTEEERDTVLAEEGVELPGWAASDMPELHSMLLDIAQHNQGYKLSIPERLRAALCYTILGSSLKVAKYTGMKANTIRSWYKQEWWKLAIKATRELYNDQLDAMMTQTLMNASHQLLDRVRNGDEVLRKDGELVRRKMSGVALATVIGIETEKRALLRGDATVKIKHESSSQRLNQIADKLSQAAAQFGNFRAPETITDAEYHDMNGSESSDA